MNNKSSVMPREISIRAAVPTELVYLGIPPAWGAWIADSLTEDSETTGCGGGAR